MAGYTPTYCVICDAEVNRAWVAENPRDSKIVYLAPCGRAVRRLNEYGIPNERIWLTGFPLPVECLGNRNLNVLRKDLGQRLRYLDPLNRFWPLHGRNIEYFLGKENCKPLKQRVLTVTFGVGGAGAQVDIAHTIAHSLREKIARGEIRLNILAGVRAEVRARLEAIRKELAAPQIRIVTGTGLEEYFHGFAECMRTTDILWTKPSELSFYCGLGIPVIMAPTIGSQEEYNQAWLLEIQAGFPQQDPQYTDQWLLDLVKAGRLADAALGRFSQGPQVRDIQDPGDRPHGDDENGDLGTAAMKGELDTPEDVFAWTESFTNLEKGTLPYDKRNYRLDRMRRLLGLFDDPDAGLRIIHVAGTKGKGSTSALLASVLHAAGHRTGLYTSPHVTSAFERIAIAGEPPRPDLLVRIGREVKAVIDSLPPGWHARAFRPHDVRAVHSPCVPLLPGGRLRGGDHRDGDRRPAGCDQHRHVGGVRDHSAGPGAHGRPGRHASRRSPSRRQASSSPARRPSSGSSRRRRKQVLRDTAHARGSPITFLDEELESIGHHPGRARHVASGFTCGAKTARGVPALPPGRVPGGERGPGLPHPSTNTPGDPPCNATGTGSSRHPSPGAWR